jgi:L-ascorbate metabolism protein UlaG (beta-lactamase superfamily)
VMRPPGRLIRPPMPNGRPLPAADEATELRVTFAGATTLLVDDGHSRLLVDPFFSRPGVVRCVVGRIGPHAETIDASLRRLGVDRLDAVVASHAHYDHAMDAPYVARRTGALLVGSASAAMVGRGFGLPEEQLRQVEVGVPLQVGGLTVTFATSAHVAPVHFPGDIVAPLTPPARLSSYRVGDCYSVHVRAGRRSILVQGSAGSVPGSLSGLPADVVYLAIGALSRASPAARERYWTEVVTTVGARRVLTTHWDDLWRPLSRPLAPLPPILDDVPATMRALAARAAEDGVDLRVPTSWQPTDPFAGLDGSEGSDGSDG